MSDEYEELTDEERAEREYEAEREEYEERKFWMEGDADHRRFGRAVYGY